MAAADSALGGHAIAVAAGSGIVVIALAVFTASRALRWLRLPITTVGFFGNDCRD